MKLLSFSINKNNLEEWRQYVVYSDFIWIKSLFSGECKQQLLDRFKFMIIIVFTLKNKVFVHIKLL